jgi:hypothetical protein
LNNYQAEAYAWVALYQLQKENKEIAPDKLTSRMRYLMDTKSESEIQKLKEKIERKILAEIIQREI